MSLDSRRVRDIAQVPPRWDVRAAVSPDERRLALFEKFEEHLPDRAQWRVRLADLHEASLIEVVSGTNRVAEAPWDIGWSPGGALMLVSPRTLERVDGAGQRHVLRRFAPDTVGATFRDPTHPGLVVTQSLERLAVYVVNADGTAASLFRERAYTGLAHYARRPGSDDVVELTAHFDGTVTFSVLRADGDEERWSLDGPKVEGHVDLAGVSSDGAYFMWPIAREDPIALDRPGGALLFRATYDGRLALVAGMRHWTPFAPLGVSPDGRAVLIPQGHEEGVEASYLIGVCCERRPPQQLLPFGDRIVLGWFRER